MFVLNEQVKPTRNTFFSRRNDNQEYSIFQQKETHCVKCWIFENIGFCRTKYLRLIS